MQTANWPAFDEILPPKMVCFGIGNGSGSKLFQSYLDGHPQIYMVPAYILMYLYPHWDQWKDEYRDNWNWDTIINAFCIKHASLLDTRQIPGHDGMTTLGSDKNQWLEIDEQIFREFLTHLLRDQPISCKTFLLAVHYAYAYARNENLSNKKVLVYHIHVHEYVTKYLAPDFPNMIALGFVRDPRSNIKGRYESVVYIDKHKLNATDATVYRRRTYYYHSVWFTESLEYLKGLDPDSVRVVRHEDMHHRLDNLMHATVNFLGIEFDNCLLHSTFGGLKWWGDKAYNMKPMNKPNPRVISLDWQKRLPLLDWFVLEGLFYNYCRKYDYPLYKYNKDNVFNRVIVFIAMLLPSHYEQRVFWNYIKFSNILSFYRDAWDEARDTTSLKDYGMNAYYRHKWSNTGLNLWKLRWYRRVLKYAHNLHHNQKNSNSSLMFLVAVQWCYVIVNIFRYLWSIVTYPVMVVKRSMLFVQAFIRMIVKYEHLPESL